MTNIALDIKDLRKNYGSHVALKGISFQIFKGELFSLLGPNGAGKTTTLRIISGLTNPSSGKIYIFGKNLFEEEIWAKKLIGFVPQQINLDLELTVEENLFIHGLLFKMSIKEIKKNRRNFLRWLIF